MAQGSFLNFKDPSLINLTGQGFDKRRLRRGDGGFDTGIQIGDIDAEGNRGIFDNGNQVGTTTHRNVFGHNEGFGSFVVPQTTTSASRSQNGEVVGDTGGAGGSNGMIDDGVGTPVASVTPISSPDPDFVGMTSTQGGGDPAVIMGPGGPVDISNLTPQVSPALQALLDRLSTGTEQVQGFKNFAGTPQGLGELFGGLNTAETQIGGINAFKVPAAFGDLGRSLDRSSGILKEIAGGSFGPGGFAGPVDGQLGEAIRLAGILGEDLGGIVPDLNQNIIPRIGEAQGLISTLGTDAGNLSVQPFVDSLTGVGSATEGLENIQAQAGRLNVDDFESLLGATEGRVGALDTSAGDVGFDSGFLNTLRGLENDQGRIARLGREVGDVGFDSGFLNTLRGLENDQGRIARLGREVGDVGFDSGFLNTLDQAGIDQRALTEGLGGLGIDQGFLNTLSGAGADQQALTSGLGNLGIDQGFLNILSGAGADQQALTSGLENLGIDQGFLDTLSTAGADQRGLTSGLGNLGIDQGFLDQLSTTGGDVDALGNKIRDLGIDRLTADVVPFDDSGLTSLINGLVPQFGAQLEGLGIPGLFGDVAAGGIGPQISAIQQQIAEGGADPGGSTGGGDSGGGGGAGTSPDIAAILALLQDMQGPTGPEVAPGGIFGDVQTALQDMLKGPTTAEGLREDPLTASILADLEESNRRRELEDREQLNRMGVLRGGDNIRLGDRRADDQSRAELAALGDSAERFRSDRTTGVTAGTQLGQALSNREIAIGELLGNLGGEQTLGGRQADLDVIGSIIAALDPAVDLGTQNAKQLGFASSLLDLLNLPPDQIAKIRSSLGI